MTRNLLILTAAVALTACHSDKIRLQGSIEHPAASARTLYLEEVQPSGLRLVDSLKVSADGRFSIRIKGSETPAFYNLRSATGHTLPLLVAGGERVRLAIADSTLAPYTVEGSGGSQLVQRANALFGSAERTLDSLNQKLAESPADSSVLIAYQLLKIKQKRAAVQFIVENPASLAAIVPLYQSTRVNESGFIFDDPADVIYFRMVADSLQKYHPRSPYARSIANDVKRLESTSESFARIARESENAADFPDLVLPDVLGNPRRLSELKGQVILVSFTASNLPELKMLNRELIETYNALHPRGLEIYQVSLDRSKAGWINTVATQRLPWISVNDLLGGASPAVRSYNIRTIPSAVLINRQGVIVRRDIKPSEVKAAVEALL